VTRARFRVVAVLLAGALAVLAARTVQVMVLGHERYAELAHRQQERKLTVPSLRGEIRTADGYLLATSVSRVAAQVDRQLLGDPELFARAAAPILGRPADELVRRLGRGPRAVWIGQKLPLETGETLRQLAPAAVVLVPDSARLYPLGSLAAPVVGFVGREELRPVGRAGLEHHFDSLLAGRPETYLAVRDAVQRQVRLRRLHTGRSGYDLELTIVARLQARCEEILGDVLERTGARSASAVVMEPFSGEILALASVPSFDPGAPGRVPPERWRLRPVQDAFEPGSTVKPMVAAAALAAGAVRPGERLDCRARGIRVAGHWMRDHADPGRYTLDEVVAHSSNTGMVVVARRLDPELLWRTLDGFGFGRRTGVGFPAEASGTLRPPARWSRMSAAALALGQELTVTPLQLATAYAAVANGGWLLRPRLVRRATGGLDEIEGRPAWRCRVMDATLAGRIAAMLRGVVTTGTGTGAEVAGYAACGKTGTAQRAVAGGFDDAHHVAWFAGFLPWPAPRAVVVVAVEEPRTDYWASTVAAPCFREIGAATMRVLGIPPSATSGGGPVGGRT